jgi:hypothetical protein
MCSTLLFPNQTTSANACHHFFTTQNYRVIAAWCTIAIFGSYLPTLNVVINTEGFAHPGI